MSIVKFENVTKIFGNGTKALEEITFQLDKSEFLVVQGKSGAGKTTLMRLMLKDLDPTEGTVFIDNDNLDKVGKRNIPKLRRKIGVVFQDFKILKERTVEENIALALDLLEVEKDTAKERISELLHLTSLEEKGQMFPSQLSGGELQRVIIARALAPQPKILFADEPTGNLDEDTAWQIIQLLEDINQQGTAVMLATHDRIILDKLDKRLIELEEGKVIIDTKKSSAKGTKTPLNDEQDKSTKPEVKKEKSEKKKKQNKRKSTKNKKKNKKKSKKKKKKPKTKKKKK